MSEMPRIGNPVVLASAMVCGSVGQAGVAATP